ISNLNGANPSTKQLDLFAKIADMLPEKEATQHNTNVMIGNNDDIRARIEQLEAERRANVIPNVPDRDRQIEEGGNGSECGAGRRRIPPPKRRTSPTRRIT